MKIQAWSADGKTLKLIDFPANPNALLNPDESMSEKGRKAAAVRWGKVRKTSNRE